MPVGVDVRPCARRRHARGEEEARGGSRLAGGLVALELERGLRRLTAGAHCGADSVERLALEVIEDVRRAVMFRPQLVYAS